MISIFTLAAVLFAFMAIMDSVTIADLFEEPATYVSLFFNALAIGTRAAEVGGLL